MLFNVLEEDFIPILHGHYASQAIAEEAMARTTPYRGGKLYIAVQFTTPFTAPDPDDVGRWISDAENDAWRAKTEADRDWFTRLAKSYETLL